MKQYGFFKATEFSAKQISVIYRKAKNGELNVEKWVINRLYELAEYYNYDSNGSVSDEEIDIKKRPRGKLFEARLSLKSKHALRLILHLILENLTRCVHREVLGEDEISGDLMTGHALQAIRLHLIFI